MTPESGIRGARTRSVKAEAVFVPVRLMRHWMTSLTELEFGIMLTLLGETWLIGLSAAPCPFDRLAVYWESLARPVTAQEIENALECLVRHNTLLVVSLGNGAGKGGMQLPLLAINRDWRGPPEMSIAATRGDP